MAIIVETGAGVAGANAYASVDTVDAYCEARGYAAWTSNTDDDAKESATLRAMTYIESLAWNGYKTAHANPLEWPRSCMEDRSGYAIASNVVPQAVVNALCEAALRELVEAGATMADTGREDAMTKLEVAGAVKLEWDASAPTVTDFRVVKALLKGLIAPSGGVRLVR